MTRTERLSRIDQLLRARRAISRLDLLAELECSSAETWHVEQRSHYDAEGRYILEVPYSDDVELLMDILKYGPQVEVLAPAALRAKVAQRLREAAAQYP